MATLSNQRGLSKVVILLLFGFLAAIILGIVFIVIGSQTTTAPGPVRLNVWGVYDDSSDVQGLFSAYTAAHPYVTFSYRKFRIEEYEEALLRGWATGTGPDIYILPSTWVQKYKSEFITPIPKSTKVAYYTTKKVLWSEETEITYQTDTSLSTNDLRRNYIDLIYDDMVIDGKIYGLPLGIDTLILYYNRELLNQARLVEPPDTWSSFVTAVTSLALTDEENNIVRAGAALGTSNNIDGAVDILTLLMLQNGTRMTAGNEIVFYTGSSVDPGYLPGVEALRFYTDFANPQKAVYTWNEDQPNALDQFAQGDLAFYIGYVSEESTIRSRSRGVDYAVRPIPQVNPDQNITFATYSVYTVSQQTRYANEAWNFIQFASAPSRVSSYLAATGKTSALRSVLTEQIADPDTGAIAEQALTAESWFRGKNPEVMEQAFIDMIDAANEEPDALQQHMREAANTIERTY